jgi:hypothetical protein
MRTNPLCCERAARSSEPQHVDRALGIERVTPVDAVRGVVEGAVGPYANNEYFEMHVDGLTPQLTN